MSKHEIDMTRLVRRKPDMDVSKITLRDENERIYETVKSMLREHYPSYRGGICLDKLRDRDWESKTFKEKVDALYCDTVFWM